MALQLADVADLRLDRVEMELLDVVWADQYVAPLGLMEFLLLVTARAPVHHLCRFDDSAWRFF
jgi:hypothetical protein